MNNDLISREALKKAIEKYRFTSKVKSLFSDGEHCMFMNIISEIDNAPTVEITDYDTGYQDGLEDGLNDIRPQGEWIPVSERLPDKNMPCLVSVGKFNFTQIAMYSDLMETIDHKIFYQGDYGKNNFQNITEYVNAWQPLPEPYMKGGAE